MRKKMYRPKIKPELIKELYKLTRARKIPMTKLVNKIIAEYLDRNCGKKKKAAV